MNPGSVFLYVQHLLGVGHLKRALVIAHALAAAGLRVTVASGGQPVELLDRSGLNWVQLPAASVADLSFGQLLDAQGQPVDDAWKARRTAALLEAWRESRADVLVTELFPFGRRQMRFELLPLLEAARARTSPPVIVSSIRDVLGGSIGNVERQKQMLGLFDRYYDHVLVHGDPSFIPLEATFSPAAQLGSRLHYTGYVVEAGRFAHPPTSAGADEVLVSVGGGAVGMALLETALQARALTVLKRHVWRVLVGHNLPQVQFVHLQQLADQTAQGNVVVQRARADFVPMLANCALSISQGGYNTVVEALSQGARSVVVPFAGGGEIEQSLRARALAERGWIQSMEENQLSAQTLASAVDRAVEAPAPPVGQLRMDGQIRTVELVAGWVRARRP